MLLACCAGPAWLAARRPAHCEAIAAHTEELDSHVHQALMDRLCAPARCMQTAAHAATAGKTWWSFVVELVFVMRRALRLLILAAPV